MATHAPSTPTPAADPHSPDRSAAALWAAYQEGYAKVRGLADDQADAAVDANLEFFTRSLKAPLVTAADAASRVELIQDMIADENAFTPTHTEALDALKAWIGCTKRDVQPVATLEEMAAIDFKGVEGAIAAATMPREEWIGFYRTGMLAATILGKSKPELMEMVRRLCEPEGGDDAYTNLCEGLDGAEHLFRGFMNAASGAHARLLSAAASVALAEEAGA